MTMITLEQEIIDQEDAVQTIKAELRRVRQELVAFREKLEGAHGEDTKPQPAEIKKIATLVTTCLETENRLEKCKAERAGIAQCGVAFDLQAARDSIGCKLNRLRACCETDAVSE